MLARLTSDLFGHRLDILRLEQRFLHLRCNRGIFVYFLLGMGGAEIWFGVGV